MAKVFHIRTAIFIALLAQERSKNHDASFPWHECLWSLKRRHITRNILYSPRKTGSFPMHITSSMISNDSAFAEKKKNCKRMTKVSIELIFYMWNDVRNDGVWFVRQKMKMEETALRHRTNACLRSARARKQCTKQLIPNWTLLISLSHPNPGLLITSTCLSLHEERALRTGLCTTVVECTYPKFEVL